MNTEFRLMPEQASSISSEIDLLFFTLIAISVVISVTIACLLIYFTLKYHRGNAAVRKVHPHSNLLILELTWVALPFALTMFLFVWGAKLYFKQAHAPAGAIEISCVARQWMWKFQHPQGTAEINDLHVPLGHDVKVNMISEDVIHSLYIPAFRVKHDVLPGRYTSIWFKATKVGQYHLFCAEYCGAKHSTMRGTVHVLDPREYQNWLSEQSVKSPVPTNRGTLLQQLRCAGCHSGGGETSRGPSLQNLMGRTVRLQNGQTITADEDYIRESIFNPKAKVVAGYDPIMPSYAGQLDESSILQLMTEIKSLGQLVPDESESAKGDPESKEPEKKEKPD